MATTPAGIGYDHVPGDGPATVLLHAGVADRGMWDPQWRALADDGRELLRVDLRGFGESTAPPAGPLDHVEDVVATLDHLGLTSAAHVVGASLGAGVAVELALRVPARVRSLTLCPPGGSLLVEATDDLRAFARAERRALAAGDLDAAVEANIAAWVVGPGRDASAVDAGVQDAVRRMQRRAFEITGPWQDIDEREPDPPLPDRLGEVVVPTLVLVGAHDLATIHDATDRLGRALPTRRRVDWPDTAHLPSLEHPERFTALLLDWLREHDG